MSRSGEAPLMRSVSGVRGIVNRTMTPDVAGRFARAFGAQLASTSEARVACIGRDGRPSGPGLADAAASALVGAGFKVVDLGVVATPTVSVMVRELRAAGGMVVTASHNPDEWNGLKCLDADGAAPAGPVAEAILHRFDTGTGADETPPAVVERDDRGHDTHLARILGAVDPTPCRAAVRTVVLDSVNGAGSVGGRLLLEHLGCRVIPMHDRPGEPFPRGPEPVPANLVALAERTVAEGADLGFALDPDADRLAIVDAAGRCIGEEVTLVLAAWRTLERSPGGVLVANLSTSRMIDDLAGHHGATVVRSPVGEAHVVEAMRHHGARLGGEGNGGVIEPAVCWVRDGLSAMAAVLDLLAMHGVPLAALVDDLPRYAMTKRAFDLEAIGGRDDFDGALDRVAETFPGSLVDRLDGLRVDVEEGWVHLRPSNTEPIVRLIAEAATPEALATLIDRAATAAGLA